MSNCRISYADDDHDFVQEVLDEDEGHYNDYATMSDEDVEQEMLRRQQEEEDLRRQAEEQQREAERQRNEQVQKQREEAFEAELARMSKEKQKEARKQKKLDAAVVRKVLRAAHHGNYYAVLGLSNREIRIPGRSITIVPGYFKLTIPEFKLFHISPQKIKKSYREKAKAVHPDKSVDGRAVEAFVAVENAASVLLDETARAEYDQHVLHRRLARRARVRNVAATGLERVLGLIGTVIGALKRILGPFGLPVLILSMLIV